MDSGTCSSFPGEEQVINRIKKFWRWNISIIVCGLLFCSNGCARFLDITGLRTEKKFSVLLVSLDTLRADRLGCYGNQRSTSPWLDFHSKGSMQFLHAFSQANLTTPSHMTLFTSLYPAAHNVGSTSRLSKNTQTLAEILAEHGYRTAAFTGGVTIGQEYGFDRGFEIYSEQDFLKNDWDFSSIDHDIGPWIKDRFSKREQFFCFLHTFRIHDPYLPPPPLHKLFDEDY